VQNFFVSRARASVASATFLICSVTFVPVVHGQQPSFNCTTDTRPDERTICASAALSQFDRQLSNLYVAARDGLDAAQQILLRDAQRNWLRQRAACGANANCIASLYRARISQFQAMLAGTPSGEPSQHRASGLSVISSGSGFFISTEGHIVTNAHVVAGCAYVRSSRGGQITRLAIDEASDLALYVASEKPLLAARIRGGRGPRVGEGVVAIGFPFKGLLSSDAIVTTGAISALAGIRNDRRSIQITAPVQPGNSGGPVLGENGSVVGVVVGKLDALKVAEIIGDIPQNVNFAVSLGTLQSFLNANSVPYVLDDSTGTKTSADISADASQYTVLLECLRPK
jgi:S1-C subfamily serine protease